MNTKIKSLLCGCGIEVSLAALVFLGGGFGPCGPSNFIGAFGLFSHFPGLFAFEALTRLSLPEWVPITFALLVQVTLFSAASYIFFTQKAKFQKLKKAA